MNNEVDTAVESIGTVLFFACWLAAVASWFYSLLEYRWLRRGDPRAFRFGPAVLRVSDTTLSAHRATLPPANVSIPNGVLVPLDAGQVGFAPALGSLFHPLSGIRNLFLFKGVITFRSGIAEAVVRAPVGISVFLGAFVAAWLVFGIFLGPSTVCTVNGVPHPPDSAECVSLSVLPPVIVVAVVAFLVWGVRRRARVLFAAALSTLSSERGAA